MDELEERLHAEGAELHTRAAAVARTEQALRDLRAATDDRRHDTRWLPRVVAVASVAAVVVACVVIVRQNDDGPQSISSASDSSATLTTVLATPTTTPSPTSIPAETTVVDTTEPTTDATLSTSTPFDNCDYSDPGKFPSNRECPDNTEVEVTTPVTLVPPLVIGGPSETMPEAIVSGEVSIAGRCVYLIDSFTGASHVIVWPAGTEWDSRRTEIVLPDGQRIVDGAMIDGGGGYYAVDNVPEVDPDVADSITACLPPGTDEHSGDVVVRAFPDSVTPPTMVPLTPTS